MIIRIGITGEAGFIGSHLAEKARQDSRFQHVPFERDFFSVPEKLAEFAGKCNVIIHLAGLSRSNDPERMYETNLQLTEMLANAAAEQAIPPCVMLGSTTHIRKDTPYHASKRDSMALLRERLPRTVELRMSNTFGPGSRPFYNSVVSTFCHLAAQKKTPEEISDVTLSLIYVEDLCSRILDLAAESPESRTEVIAHTDEIPLPCLWNMLTAWSKAGGMPELRTKFEAALWTTFRSYL